MTPSASNSSRITVAVRVCDCAIVRGQSSPNSRRRRSASRGASAPDRCVRGEAIISPADDLVPPQRQLV